MSEISRRSPEDLEWPDCNLCGSSEASTAYDFSPLKIVRCRRCGLVYTRPRLNYGVIEADLYRSDFWRQYEQAHEEYGPEIKLFAEKWLQALERESGRDAGRLLEVGAGLGAILSVARSRGYDVHAIEPSEYAFTRLRSAFGAERVFDARAEELDSLNLSLMDFAVMLATIEHLHDPLEALAQLNRILADDGLLLVSTGVFGSFNQRVAGKKWTIIHPEGHLYYFSKRTLRETLAKAGFEICHLETNAALINTLTESRLLVKLFNNRVTTRLRVPEWTQRRRLGDEMFVIARKVRAV